MSLWRRETLRLGIGADTMAVAPGATTLAVGSTDRGLADALQELLAGHHGAVLALAGTDVCRHWTLAPPQGVASLGELRAIVTSRCCTLFGGAADQWRVVADWSLSRPFACAALPVEWLDTLRSAAARAGMRLRVESATLAAARALTAWLPSDGWSAWPTPTSLILLRREGSRVTWLQASRRLPDAGMDELIAEAALQVRRRGLRSGAGVAQDLTWLGPAAAAAPVAASGDATITPPIRRADGPSRWPVIRPGMGEAQWAAAVAVMA